MGSCKECRAEAAGLYSSLEKVAYFRLKTNQNFQMIKKEANVGEFYTRQCFRYVSRSKSFTGKYRIVCNWSSKFATCLYFIRRIRNDIYEISSALSFDRKHQIVLVRLTIARYTLHVVTCKTRRPNKLRCVCNRINSVKKRLGGLWSHVRMYYSF